MQDTPTGEKLPEKDGLMAAFEAVSALEVLDVYRALSQRESERVYAFIQDALRRQAEPTEEAAYTALEDFWIFVRAYRDKEPMETTLRFHDLSADQYERYRAAWETITTVAVEVDTLCAVKYGAKKEGR